MLIAKQHSHVVHLVHRPLLCTCRPCALLFTELQWNEPQIPVRMAFFFHNSDLGRTLAFYPSPAGATESLLPMDAWHDGPGASPLGMALRGELVARSSTRRGLMPRSRFAVKGRAVQDWPGR